MWGRAHQRPLNRHEVERTDDAALLITVRGHRASIAATMATASSVDGCGEITDGENCVSDCLSEMAFSDITDSSQFTKAYCRVCAGAALRAWCAAS